MKLSDYARDVLGVSYQTAWRWWKADKLPHPAKQTKTGSVIVEYTPGSDSGRPAKVAAVYARVSSNEKKGELDTQADRLVGYANARGWKVKHCVKEVGSGINDARKKLKSLLGKDDYSILVVEHKDRLARFGVNYMVQLLGMLGVQVEIVNTQDNGRDELMMDLISIITSFCARIYGQRRSTRKTEKIIAELETNGAD